MKNPFVIVTSLSKVKNGQVCNLYINKNPGVMSKQLWKLEKS